MPRNYFIQNSIITPHHEPHHGIDCIAKSNNREIFRYEDSFWGYTISNPYAKCRPALKARYIILI